MNFFLPCPGTEALPDTRDDDGNDGGVTAEGQEDWESCSDDEDDSDEEWIDVHHSSDDEQVERVCMLWCLWQSSAKAG